MPGEAPRVSQQKQIPLTPNLTNKILILMPSFSNDLFDTETISDQTNQCGHIYAAYLTCVFNRQPGNSVLANFHLPASQTPKFLTLYFLTYPTRQHPINHTGSPTTSTFGLDPNSANSQSF